MKLLHRYIEHYPTVWAGALLSIYYSAIEKTKSTRFRSVDKMWHGPRGKFPLLNSMRYTQKKLFGAQWNPLPSSPHRWLLKTTSVRFLHGFKELILCGTFKSVQAGSNAVRPGNTIFCIPFDWLPFAWLKLVLKAWDFYGILTTNWSIKVRN